MKAMILAAGFGTRLLPATKFIPKPCFPVLNKPIILHIIESLKSAGVDEIVINLHHLGEKIKECVDASGIADLTIHYSYEEEILGTAGGIKKVQDILRDDTFILYNGDIFSQVHLGSAIQFHKESGSKATMIVKEGDHKSFIGLDGHGKIVRFPYGALKDSEDYSISTFFTGIHILEPIVFDYIPEDLFYCINSNVYPDILSDGHEAFGYVTDSFWHDIGTPVDFLSVNAAMLSGIEFMAGEGTVIDNQSRIGPDVIIGSRCTVRENCTVRGSVIFDDVELKSRSNINNAIILDGCVVASGTALNNVIVTKEGPTPLKGSK